VNLLKYFVLNGKLKTGSVSQINHNQINLKNYKLLIGQNNY